MDALAEQVIDARARTLGLIADLDDEQLRVPYLPTINPLLWEACHAAYFHELWVLRRGAGREPLLPNVDELFDSVSIDHELRWRLPVPSREECVAYLNGVRDGVLDVIERGVEDAELRRMIQYAIHHEDMHAEALTYTRQTLAYPRPSCDPVRELESCAPVAPGDAHFEAQTFEMGARPDCEFCFDNEKWAHPVEVDAFAIARTAVSEGEFAAFVEDDGYARRELWTPEGWTWVQAAQAGLPLFWRRTRSGELERRHFDQWTPLAPTRAIQHVCWYEADAFARWAGRRLPTEAEWELAASRGGAGAANLDGCSGGPVDVAAFATCDTHDGCRQMLGNVWEWTSTTFAPYPGFVADMYEDYSQTSFNLRKVLRGGAWATRSRLMRPTLRNFFQQSRRDVFAGLRTCALAPA